MSKACPVPTATTRTSIPVAALNAGKRCGNRPDCSVLVVEAITIILSCARDAKGRAAAATTSRDALPR